jgi:hypothetical protein
MTDIDLKDELNSLANILALDDFEAHAEIILDGIKRITELEMSLQKIYNRLEDNDSWLAQSIDCRNLAETALVGEQKE